VPLVRTLPPRRSTSESRDTPGGQDPLTPGPQRGRDVTPRVPIAVSFGLGVVKARATTSVATEEVVRRLVGRVRFLGRPGTVLPGNVTSVPT